MRLTLLGKPAEEQGVFCGIAGHGVFLPEPFLAFGTEGVNYCRTNSTGSSLHTPQTKVFCESNFELTDSPQQKDTKPPVLPLQLA